MKHLQKISYRLKQAQDCFWAIAKVFGRMIGYLYRGVRDKQGMASLKRAASLTLGYCHQLSLQLARGEVGYNSLDGEAIKRLRKTVQGLHATLPNGEQFSYSILIPVYKPKPIFLQKALQSALDQTASHMEVLVGFDGPQPEEVYEVVETLKKRYPSILKSFEIDRQKTGGGISATTNTIAEHAKGRFFVLMDHDDWIRPDLLFRYEQALRLLPNPDNSVLYCNEYKINEKDAIIPGSARRKPETPPFPYVFINFICHCLMIPSKLWQQVDGLRLECNFAQDYDLILRLDIAKAEFHNVPFFLYAWRSHSLSTAQNIYQKKESIEVPLRAWRDYCQVKGLHWKIEHGYIPTSYRAIPILSEDMPTVQAFVLFKDQKHLTLKAIQSLLKQKNVRVFITAVDNASQDTSIAAELVSWGVEVLSITEPFNFSRLNNLAVQRSKISPKSRFLLFMNNDVELQNDALEEMCRWIEQPGIGMVGCRLNYPNGRLQHGGIDLNANGPAFQMTWEHTDKNKPFECLGMARVLHVADAVTAACALVQREIFMAIGGFDEIWYPIAFSDTNLAVKLKHRNLWSFYTPYAVGVHHESVSRCYENIEDVDMSTWLHQKYLASQELSKIGI